MLAEGADIIHRRGSTRPISTEEVFRRLGPALGDVVSLGAPSTAFLISRQELLPITLDSWSENPCDGESNNRFGCDVKFKIETAVRMEWDRLIFGQK
jgi:hypothetical protein